CHLHRFRGRRGTIVFWPVRGGVRCFNILYTRRMRAPAPASCSRWGIGYGHVRRFPHKRSSTQGPRTSAGKRGSLKTPGQARCDFPRFRPVFSRHPSHSFPPLRLVSAASSLRKSGSACMRATIVDWITPATSSPLISITCVSVGLAPALPIRMWNRNACYWDVSVFRRRYVDDSNLRSHVEGARHRAPRYGKGRSLVDSARFGLWLARG